MARKFNRTQRKRGGGRSRRTVNENMRSPSVLLGPRKPKLTEKGEAYRDGLLERLKEKVSKEAMRKLKEEETAKLEAALAAFAALGL